MNLVIFSDARAVAGNASLFDASLSERLSGMRGKDPSFHHFVKPALRFSSALTLLGGLFDILMGLSRCGSWYGPLANARVEALAKDPFGR